MDLRLQRFAAWCGPAILVLVLGLFVVLARLIPPLSPTATPAEVAHFFIDHKLGVRLSLALSMLFVPLFIPFLVSLCLRIREIEGKWGVLSLIQLMGGVVTFIAVLFPMMVLGAAAYRPEQRPAEITQALDDVFWLMFVGIVGTLVLQAITLATATFIDRGDPPVLPRWYGYFNVWYAILAVPGGAVMIFNDGPLAWNGMFAFWIPTGAFGVWVLASTVVVLRSLAVERVADVQEENTSRRAHAR